MEIQDKTIEKVWKKALKHIMKEGYNFKDNEGRTCREIFNLILKVEKPDEETTKPMEIISKLKKWIYPSQEELANSILNKKFVPGYYFTYGDRAFNFRSEEQAINQVDKFIIPLLKKDPTSRRAILAFYNPLKDSLLYRKEIPSRMFTDFKIRNKYLNATTIVRSNDIFIGWPADIYQVYVMQKYIAEKLNCSVGSTTTISISAHIFEEQFEDIQKILKITSKE
jgi:thymidylate synthase